MNREEAITIIRKEYLCVDRDCDIEKSCGRCDLMMPSKEPILQAYKMAMQALEQEPFDDAKYHEEHGEVIVDKAVWEDAKRALEQEPSGDAVSRQAVLDLAKFDERKGLGSIIHAFDVEQLPSVKPQESKWISTSERLPQINEWVLCQCRAGYKVLRLTSYGCYCNDTQEYMDSFVIAWMPLPSPFDPQERSDKG